jgi:peptide/nickel transport system substrate-binding protein
MSKILGIVFFCGCLWLALWGGMPVWGGETITIAMYQEPETLNPYLGTQAVIRVTIRPSVEGLIGITPEGEFYPLLAAEVPTEQNGGVSADGLRVTYTLKKGITWQDGTPVTAADVQFTWEAIMNPENLVKSQSGYDLITSIDTPDAWTVVLHFKELYTPYLTLFPYILPKHILGQLPNINQAPYNQKPVGTGPFMVTEWVSGDHITLLKNPHYRHKDKIRIDRIFLKIVPSQTVGLSQLRTGEVDMVWGLNEAMSGQAERIPDVYLHTFPSPGIERLVLNLSTPEPPHNGNADFPHPILGELQVRRALLYGKAQVAASIISMGWATDRSIAPSKADPEKAMQLLEAAGWQKGSDGIRQKNGQRLSLQITTTTGNKLREQIEQVLQAMLKSVGIELRIRNLPSAVLFGSWANNADRKHGRFDILLYTAGPGLDPHAHLYEYFHSSRIPIEANQGQGSNFSRLRDAAIDGALERAESTVNLEKRKEAYRIVQQRINELLPHILLYNPLSVTAVSQRVKGLIVHPWDSITCNTEEWYVGR